MKRNLSLALLTAAALTMATKVAADWPTVYDNSTTYLQQYLYTGNEFGDEITFGGPDTSVFLSSIKFEYFLSHNTDKNETARLRIYDNTGTPTVPLPGHFGTPGNMLYDSGNFSLTNGFNTVTIDGLFLYTPARNVTWTVQFGGVTGNEVAGLLFYDPPTVGGSFNDYWEKVGSTWTLKHVDGPVNNFGAVVTAVPEPSIIQLAVVGVGSWLGLIAYRRRGSK